MSDDDAEAYSLLSRFPGPVTLDPSYGRLLKPVLIGLAFAAIGWFLIRDGAHPIWGWFTASFFGIGTVTIAVQLLPGANSLTLDAEGFETRVFFFRRIRSQWQNVTNFIAKPGLPPAPQDIKFVWYNDTQWDGWWLARKETAMLGYNASLGGNYGRLSAEALADLMIRWQELAQANSSTAKPD